MFSFCPLSLGCSEILLKHSEEVTKLGYSLFELLSEALGLDPNHLKDMDCAEGLIVLCHYYPACPQPELTLGASKHEDDDFLTVLLQDHVGGLQVLYGNQWIDVSSNTWSSCSQYWGPSTGKVTLVVIYTSLLTLIVPCTQQSAETNSNSTNHF